MKELEGYRSIDLIGLGPERAVIVECGPPEQGSEELLEVVAASLPVRSAVQFMKCRIERGKLLPRPGRDL